MGLKEKPKPPYLGLFKTKPFPSSKKLLIKGFRLNDFSEKDFQLLKKEGKKLGQKYFHIKEGESLDHYEDRINQFLKLNIPLIERILNGGGNELGEKEDLQNDPYFSSLEIGQPLNLEGKDLYRPNVIYIGNADHPLNNPLFTPLVLKTIHKNLKNNLNFSHDHQGIILFGSGQQKVRDVFQMTKDQNIQLVSRHPPKPQRVI